MNTSMSNKRESTSSLLNKSKSSNYQPGASTKHKKQSASTRTLRQKQKEQKQTQNTSAFDSQNEISMEKITHNLKQTEQALREFQNSFKQIQTSAHSKGNLNTAESSTQSLVAPLFMFGNSKLQKDEPTRVENQNLKQGSPSSEESSSSSDSSNQDQQHSFSPSICSEKEITQSLETHQSLKQKGCNKAYSVEIIDVDDKENNPLINYLQSNRVAGESQILHCEEKISSQHQSSVVSDSFRNYIENKQSQNSQAIAGAMRALQRKIKSLEQENNILKECFQGVQSKCMSMEKSYQEQKQQTLDLLKHQIHQESNDDNSQRQDTTQNSSALLTEIELLHQQVNQMRAHQQTVDEVRAKYKQKCNQLQLVIQDLQLKLESNTDKFNKQRQEYQDERSVLISQYKQLEKHNEELMISNKRKDEEIVALKKQVEEVKQEQQKKMNKYKKNIHELRRDLKVLEKSHELSQKALKHTEQFVDEVVHVNDQLVNSLSKNKKKLRSLSGSSRRSRRDGSRSNLYYTNELRRDTFQSNDDSLGRDYIAQGQLRVMNHASTPKNMIQTAQKPPLINMESEREMINRTQEPKRLNMMGAIPHSGQTTAQKPPKSQRNIQRCFSFSKNLQLQQFDRQQPYQSSNQQYQQYLQNNNMISLSLDNRQEYSHSQQHSLETSRFHDEGPYCENNQNRSRPHSRSNCKSTRSKKTIMISDEFTLQPYENQINNVTQKIERIEKDLLQLGDEYKQSLNGEKYLQGKQNELVKLKSEHDRLMKNIRERSVGKYH